MSKIPKLKNKFVNAFIYLLIYFVANFNVYLFLLLLCHNSINIGLRN